jgi:hypothetical protein
MAASGGSGVPTKEAFYMSEANDTRKQKRLILTLWEGGILEIRVPKITFNRRQLFLAVFLLFVVLTEGDKLPEAIAWGKNLLALLR